MGYSCHDAMATSAQNFGSSQGHPLLLLRLMNDLIKCDSAQARLEGLVPQE